MFSTLLFCKELVVIRVLILDQARTTGFALYVNGELTEHGSIELGKKGDTYENILLYAKQKIQELVSETQADIVVLEDIQQQNQNVNTYKKLAMLMGALLCLFQEINKPCEIVPPSRWKSFCGIQGKKRAEQKANTILFVKEKFNLDEISDDVADSISMGWWAVNNLEFAMYEINGCG